MSDQDAAVGHPRPWARPIEDLALVVKIAVAWVFIATLGAWWLH